MLPSICMALEDTATLRIKSRGYSTKLAGILPSFEYRTFLYSRVTSRRYGQTNLSTSLDVEDVTKWKEVVGVARTKLLKQQHLPFHHHGFVQRRSISFLVIRNSLLLIVVGVYSPANVKTMENSPCRIIFLFL